MKSSTIVNIFKLKIYQLFIIWRKNTMKNRGFYRIVLYLFMLSWMSFNLSSCKTCKCPAYSNTEYQNPVNKGDTAILLF